MYKGDTYVERNKEECLYNYNIFLKYLIYIYIC